MQLENLLPVFESARGYKFLFRVDSSLNLPPHFVQTVSVEESNVSETYIKVGFIQPEKPTSLPALNEYLEEQIEFDIEIDLLDHMGNPSCTMGFPSCTLTNLNLGKYDYKTDDVARFSFDAVCTSPTHIALKD